MGHTILEIAYHLLTRQEAYQELGALSFDERDRQHLVRRLEALGYHVNLKPKHPAAWHDPGTVPSSVGSYIRPEPGWA